MRLVLSRAQADAIRAQAREAAPAECCGLLLGDRATGLVEAILPATNVAAEPLHRFEIDPSILLAAHKAARGGGPGIVGHYHSHPGGEPIPSAIDAAQAQARGEIWLLVGRDGDMRAWQAVPNGRLHGRFDEVERAWPASSG